MAKILVADDNSNIQKMVGLALKDQGIDVVAVGNGEAAVRKISDIRPDLVLADVFMPVRNGYEVCRYVKEDSTLSHIPVILLVGAFDPLDEQEAQRVGADGVLKKPFVPPDPLISMVKSALIRAGVPLGNEPAPAARTPEPAAAPNTKAILNAGVSSKLAALSPSPIPEAQAEPLPEEFPAPPQAVRIAVGTNPVAFGSLLETPEAEEDVAVTARPLPELEEARAWGSGAETDEVEEEEDEKPGQGGWRPGGLDESADEPAVPSRAGKTKDWREEGFHGNSPARISTGRRWTPGETTQLAEVAEAPSVGVSTLEPKPSAPPAPFAGDAWAAALATNVEEKIVKAKESPAEMNDASVAALAPVEAPAAAPLENGAATASEPANWAAVTQSPWEMEAKKASMLAATWDTPAAPEPPNVIEAEQFLADQPVPAEEPVAAEPEPASAAVTEAAEQSSFSDTTEFAHGAEAEVAEAATPGSVYQPEEHLDINATQELPSYAENESSYTATPLLDEVVAPGAEAFAPSAEAKEETAAEPQRETVPETPQAMAEPAGQAQQPDMDALVARVLSKMNPEVMQKVTQEILKPVIQALIKEELNAKK